MRARHPRMASHHRLQWGHETCQCGCVEAGLTTQRLTDCKLGVDGAQVGQDPISRSGDLVSASYLPARRPQQPAVPGLQKLRCSPLSPGRRWLHTKIRQ